MPPDSDGRPILIPFLKWAGGKRWLAAQCPELFPRDFDRYVEPFLGSGAVYFYLQPQNALLSDANAALIDTYKEVKSNHDKVEYALKRHHHKHCETYYYQERARKHHAAHEKAAQFIYLNRTCWNGLYRVNRQGEFNVPIGTKTAVVLDSDDFKQISTQLRHAALRNADFETVLDKTVRGDFAFIDPPYITRHNFNGFVKYNDKIFSWDDQERLAAAVRRAAKRGVKILVTNADHASVRELYRGVGERKSIKRQSVLAADSTNRGVTTELAIAINFIPRE